MIDALGVSNYSIKECKQFLEKRNKLLERLDDKKRIYKDWLVPYRESSFSIVGDTLIIAWPIDLKRIPTRFTVLNEIVKDVNLILNWGIQNEILFRGSFGIGDYLTGDNTILGPAISDAHKWYEKTDWFGIIFSRKSQLWIESAFEEESEEKGLAALNIDRQGDFFRLLVRYPVPLKTSYESSKTEEFWVIAWPSWYCNLKNGKRVYDNLDDQGPKSLVETPRELLLNQLFKIYGTGEAELKYLNSIAFFDWYCKNIPLNELSKPILIQPTF